MASLKYITGIQIAKNFHELEKIILEARRCNEFTNAVVSEAFKKLATKEFKNAKFRYELAKEIPIDTLPTLDKNTLHSVLVSASENNDYSLAHNSFRAMKILNAFDFYFYASSFKEARLNSMPPEVMNELGSIWTKIKQHRVDDNFKVLTKLCTALSFSRDMQKSLILQVIAKPAYESFNCGVLGCFLKHCSATNDVDLAVDIWNWGKSIMHREHGTAKYFSVTLAYYRIIPPSFDELRHLWGRITSNGLDGKVELVNAMCSALSFNPSEQTNFIKYILSKEPEASFECGLLGGFLKQCSGQRDWDLAQRVWAWGLEIRKQWRGTFELSQITIQYICMCGELGNLDVLEQAWEEARRFAVDGNIKVRGAFLGALTEKGEVDRVLEVFNDIPGHYITEQISCSTLKALSRAGRDFQALNLLKRLLRENSESVSSHSYDTVIDALSRKGNYKEAFALIDEGKNHGFYPSDVTWTAILSSCRRHKNLSIAIKAFEEFKKVNQEPAELRAVYYLLVEVYKACGEEANARHLKNEIISRGLVDEGRNVHLALSDKEVLSFGDNLMPPQLPTKVCHEILDAWMEILRNMTEIDNCRHMEMLASSNACIASLNRKRVFAQKSLQESLDAHAASLPISRTYDAEILLSDRSSACIIMNGIAE